METKINKDGLLTPTVSKISITVRKENGAKAKEDDVANWTLLLLLAGAVTTFGTSIPFGYNLGAINTPGAAIRSFCNESFVSRYDISLSPGYLNMLWASIVSTFIIGGCMGAVMGAIIADSFGRKGAIYIINSLELIAACLLYFSHSANSVEMLLAGRLIIGVAGGLTVSVIPMYLMELAPLKLTGSVGVWCPLGVTFGVLLGQVMGLDSILGGSQNWPSLLAAYGVLPLLCTPFLLILPESPKYLYMIKKNQDRAIKELARVRGVSVLMLTEEIAQLREEAGTCRKDQIYNMSGVARDSRLRLPLLLVCAMQGGQQLSGINAVFYYSSSTFTNVGLDSYGASLATIGVGVTNFTAAIISLRLSSRSRRSTILMSIIGVIVSLAFLGVAGVLTDFLPWMVYVSIAATMTFVFSCGIGLAPIPYFIASELFEVGPRPAAMSWGSLSNWAGNFVIGMSFPSIQGLIGPYSFFIFTAIMISLYLFLRKYLPETQGRTSNEIAALCRDGLQSRPRQPLQESCAIELLQVTNSKKTALNKL